MKLTWNIMRLTTNKVDTSETFISLYIYIYIYILYCFNKNILFSNQYNHNLTKILY